MGCYVPWHLGKGIDAYLTLCRSKEEVYMLKEEAQNVFTFYEQKEETVNEKIEALSVHTDDFSRGAMALLHIFKIKVKLLKDKACHTLRVMQSHSELPAAEEDSDDFSDDSDSSCSDLL